MKENKKFYKGVMIRTCRKCKVIIDEKSLYDYCPECYKKIDEVFQKIREYIENYPGATAFEIEQETGIPYHVVNNFVRDGRLIEIPNAYLNIECKGCGCLLLSAHHKYCPHCRKRLEEDIEKAKLQLTYKLSDEKAKMHLEIVRNRK